MTTITAQELKVGGLSIIKKLLKDTRDLIIKERGQDRYAIVNLDYYNKLKLCELEVAYMQSQKDLKNGKFEVINDATAHVTGILKEIDNEK